MAQVVPSLMMTMALRHAFDIPGGEGRIQNVDESMCYMFNPFPPTWTLRFCRQYVFILLVSEASRHPNNMFKISKSTYGLI